MSFGGRSVSSVANFLIFVFPLQALADVAYNYQSCGRKAWFKKFHLEKQKRLTKKYFIIKKKRNWDRKFYWVCSISQKGEQYEKQ